jgi:hypothetical protein
VELARQVFDAFNRRDLGAYLALMDADVEAGLLLVALEGDYRGQPGSAAGGGTCTRFFLTTPARSSTCATSET